MLSFLKNSRVFFLLLIVAQNGYSQFGTFENYSSFCDTCSKKLYLNIPSTSFIKNNEYTSPFSTGFTGVGFFFQPSVEYYIGKNTSLTAGTHLLKYSGLENFSQVIPIFRVRHRLTEGIEVVMGNIFGNLNHKQEEALYRFDNYYQNNLEYGLQLMVNKKHLWSDTWLNWEKFIFNGSNYQEKFTLGNHTRLYIVNDEQLKIGLPAETRFNHRGGEIDSSNLPIITTYNGSGGFLQQIKFNNHSFIELEQLFLLYSDLSFRETNPANNSLYKNGSASYLKLTFRHKFVQIMAGYWNSYRFIAPQGEFLFQSVSENDPMFYSQKRSVITSKFIATKNIQDKIKLELRGDFYFDTDLHKFDYSYGFYLIINESFFLKNIGK